MYIIYTNIMDINAVGKEPAERERRTMHVGEGMIDRVLSLRKGEGIGSRAQMEKLDWWGPGKCSL